MEGVRQGVQALRWTEANQFTDHTRLTAFFPGQPGDLSRHQKDKTTLDLNEARDDGDLGCQRHQLDHMQTICTSLQTDNHTSTSSLNFYRPDVLLGAQPAASKH